MRDPTPLFDDEVERGVVRLRTLLGLVQSATAARGCAASREAIEEQEEAGEVGCPLCGAPAALHRDEGTKP